MPPQSTEIYRLMNDERLLHPGRNNAPKEIIVLCHGESCQFRDPGSETCWLGQGYMVSRQPRQYHYFPRWNCIIGHQYWKFWGI